MQIKNYTTPIALIITVISVLLSFYCLMPRYVKPLNTDLSDFSAERASIHIKELSKTKHPSGSEELKLVREYLISQITGLGQEYHIQSDSEQIRRYANRKVEINNIITRIKGSRKGKAILVLAHYDSVQDSYGAADDASGIATILEALRAYKFVGKKSLNDIIILFTDGEEQGLLGAKLFANKHPWAKEVGFAINLEARGSGGPSFTLVETNSGNANLLRACENFCVNW